MALFGFVAGVFPLFDGDIFWHLAAGRWILEHGGLPATDPFRFTAENVPWIDHEWLFQVLVRGMEVVGGLSLVFWAKAAALGGLAFWLFRDALRAGLVPGLAALVSIGATMGVRPRFLARPEIVTLFAILVLLRLLERRRRNWLGLVVLVVVWVNFHGEALLAPGIAFLFLLGRALDDGGLDAARGGWRTIVGVPVALAGCLLVNPYGWRLIEVPLGIRGALADLPAVNAEWMSAFRAPQPYLFGGLVLVVALALAARGRLGRVPALAWGLPAAATAVVALSAVRHQALFFTVAAPFVARTLAALAPAATVAPRSARRLAVGAAAVAALVAAWCIAPPASGPLRPRHGGLEWGIGIDRSIFPVEVVERLAARPAVGRLYNELLHGGYLLWKTYPPRKVFIDGRMELEPRLLHDVGAARRDARAWRELLAASDVVGALVPHDDRTVPVFEPAPDGSLQPAGTAPIQSLLFPPEEFVLVIQDEAGRLYLRRDEAARTWKVDP